MFLFPSIFITLSPYPLSGRLCPFSSRASSFVARQRSWPLAKRRRAGTAARWFTYRRQHACWGPPTLEMELTETPGAALRPGSALLRTAAARWTCRLAWVKRRLRNSLRPGFPGNALVWLLRCKARITLVWWAPQWASRAVFVGNEVWGGMPEKYRTEQSCTWMRPSVK